MKTANVDEKAKETEEVLPRYAATMQPETRLYRFAWFVWLICVFLGMILSLIMYLKDKFS
ncbi:MAG: hypothetical protein R3B84_10415 [Zavarzinella sp.]